LIDIIDKLNNFS